MSRIANQVIAACLCICVISALFTACRPEIKGPYRGIANNRTGNVSADIYLVLNETGPVVTGTMYLGSALTGGGNLSGRRDGNEVTFVTHDSLGGRITWTGKVGRRSIEGSYVAEPAGLRAVLGQSNQYGDWSVKR